MKPWRLPKLLATLLLAPLLAACPATTGPFPGESGYPAEIRGVGDSPNYPLRVGRFQRGSIIAYAPDLKNISIGYSLYEPNRQAASTIYFYPVGVPDPNDPEIVLRHYAEIKASIEQIHRGARVLEESRAGVRQEEKTVEGLKTVYGYREVFAGREQNLASELYLFRQGNRFIKFRHTYPLDQRDALEDDLKLLMETLKWADSAAPSGLDSSI